MVSVSLGYDEMGNRTYREDQAAIAASVNYFDELYDYDDVNRLTGLQRGNLNGTYDGLESLSKIGAEAWTHDATGNWKTYKQDTDMDAAWELEQARDHNKANEIDTDQQHGDPDNPITTTTGTNWVDPIQDAVGNMTTLPSPLSLTTALDCTFDAWNRLVETDDGTNTTSFGYDGLNRRVILYDGTTPRYYFHSNRWQVIEERTGLSMVLDRRVPLLACLAVHRVSTPSPVSTAGQASSGTRRRWSLTLWDYYDVAVEDLTDCPAHCRGRRDGTIGLRD